MNNDDWIETFVFALKGDDQPVMLLREDKDGLISFTRRIPEWGKHTIVKAYAPIDWQYGTAPRRDGVIIGYATGRITPEQAQFIREAVAHYWYIPF